MTSPVVTAPGSVCTAVFAICHAALPTAIKITRPGKVRPVSAARTALSGWTARIA